MSSDKYPSIFSCQMEAIVYISIPCLWCSLLLFTFSLWLDGVLPLVMDRETTAQEKCFQILEEVLLGSIVPYSKLVAWHTVRTPKPIKHFYTNFFLVTMARKLFIKCLNICHYNKFRKKKCSRFKFPQGSPSLNNDNQNLTTSKMNRSHI